MVLAGGAEAFEGGQEPRAPLGRKRCLQAPCFALLLSCFVKLPDLLHEAFGHRVLLAGVAPKTNEREEAIRPLVLGLAVRETGQSADPPLVRRARVGIVASRQGLRGEGAQELWEDGWVFEPRLEIAGAGLDDGARSAAVGRELREREIVDDRVTVLTGWPDVDGLAASIAVLE